MFGKLTDANIGSAVRWLIVNLGAYLAAQGIAVGFDWTAIAGAAASVAMLAWSYWANKNKTA